MPPEIVLVTLGRPTPQAALPALGPAQGRDKRLEETPRSFAGLDPASSQQPP